MLNLGGKKHAKKDTTDESEEEQDPTPQPSPTKTETTEDPFKKPQSRDQENVVKKDRKHRRRNSKKRRDNKRGEDRKGEEGGWNLARTSKEDYPSHVIVKDKNQLQQLEFYIASKVMCPV